MSFKPGDFFVGIIDFFAILLPGALLAFLIQPYAITYVFNGKVLPALADPTQRWIAYIFTSYVLGHIVSTVGGPLDEVSNRFLNPRFSLFKRSDNELTNVWWKRVKPEILKVKLDHKPTPLEECARGYVKPFLEGYKNINELSVIKSYVQLKNPVAAAEIDRLKAISRFFRSLTIILFIVIIIFSYKTIRYRHSLGPTIIGPTIICFPLWMFSIWLYSYQRWKREGAIYSFFIALNLDKLPRQITGPEPNNRMHPTARQHGSQDAS